MVQYYEATQWKSGLKFTANNQYTVERFWIRMLNPDSYFLCTFTADSVPRPRRIRIETPPKFKFVNYCIRQYCILPLCPSHQLKAHRNVSFYKNFQTSVQKQYSRDLDPIYPELNRPNPVIRPRQTRSWSAKPAHQRVSNDLFFVEDQAF